jgi:hypothetical protein
MTLVITCLGYSKISKLITVKSTAKFCIRKSRNTEGGYSREIKKIKKEQIQLL